MDTPVSLIFCLGDVECEHMTNGNAIGTKRWYDVNGMALPAGYEKQQ